MTRFRDTWGLSAHQFDRLGDTGFDPITTPVATAPQGAPGDDPRMLVMHALAASTRTRRLDAAWRVLYHPSGHVQMHHRSMALGIIDGTGDPLLSPMEKGVLTAAGLGHKMGPVESVGLSSGTRSTCTRCGAAVLVASHFPYGSAVELDTPCPGTMP